MKVSFGIINYNRLFYLRSCAKTLMESVEDYDDVEFVCIDDNSSEDGTEEFLQYLSDKGWKVINQEDYRKGERDSAENDVAHINPFADALNILCKETTGDLLLPLQGDCQFVRKNWIKPCIELFKMKDDIAALLIDAQRKIRIVSSSFGEAIPIGDNVFSVDMSRGVPGAGDVIYSRSLIDSVGGWKIEESMNPESLFSQSVDPSKKVYISWVPVTAAIYTDKRGTNARVRGNKRFGDYWSAKDDLYYQWVDNFDVNWPIPIENYIKANGWDLPIDETGNWKKNPIDIGKATEGDYTLI